MVHKTSVFDGSGLETQQAFKTCMKRWELLNNLNRLVTVKKPVERKTSPKSSLDAEGQPAAPVEALAKEAGPKKSEEEIEATMVNGFKIADSLN